MVVSIERRSRRNRSGFTVIIARSGIVALATLVLMNAIVWKKVVSAAPAENRVFTVVNGLVF
jgi:hypothetical protein